jgi:hypothetical protein
MSLMALNYENEQIQLLGDHIYNVHCRNPDRGRETSSRIMIVNLL